MDSNIIQEAGELLLKAAPSGSLVYIFGSRARDDSVGESDFDFLVVEPDIVDQHAEMIRLRDTLRPLRIAADVVVTSRRLFEEWRTTPNNILFEAARHGRALHEVA